MTGLPPYDDLAAMVLALAEPHPGDRCVWCGTNPVRQGAQLVARHTAGCRLGALADRLQPWRVAMNRARGP